ncbi:hypothetical protein PFUGPA_03556 [Plasmodium falciparum Palo Alto/Uganda]|uniref:Uncharacterized protein n=1 Tax=Plasmodium falciparum (isolate Palo Alto / Uganda) TaxID=57270 RepID=W4IWD1_PLAFP|nr:hypothetical protein PFUGPA_03556 [Plasmodium falciparum Palo Alto/Uganda]
MSEKRKCNKYNYFDIFLLKVEILYLNFINITNNYLYFPQYFLQNFLFRRIIKIKHIEQDIFLK